MKHLFIINPVAGKGQADRYHDQIEVYFTGRKEKFEIIRTEGPGHATRAVRDQVEKEDCRVYSIGGDGTLNEVLNGLTGSNSQLGVIPAGSGNDFYRSLDIANDHDILARTIEGSPKRCSLGLVNGRYFLNVASAGIDATIVHNAARFKKLPFLSGQGAYILGIFYTVFSYRSFEASISLDKEETIRKRTLLAAVANGRYYGGGMMVAPDADLTSDSFQVCHVDHASPVRIIRLFPTLIKGEHGRLKEVTFHQAEEVTIEAMEGFMLNIDGEVQKVDKATFRLINEGVKILVPRD